MRLFFAVPLPPAVRDELSRVAKAIRLLEGDEGIPVKWVRPDHIHLTLRFLGGCREDRLPALRDIGHAVAAAAPPFRVTTSSLGAFPSLARPRVLWAGLQPSPTLASLAEDLSAALFRAGFPGEDRPFAPHLTLGRVKSAPDTSRTFPRKLGSLVEHVHKQRFAELIIPVREFYLIESELAPEGARYHVIETFPLTGKGGAGDGE